MSFCEKPPFSRGESHEGILVAGILLIAFLVRLSVLLHAGGSAHPDEIFQSVEPAHYLSYGYWIKAWEWTAGIRSWLLPAVYAGLFRAGQWVRIDDSLRLIFLIHSFNLLLSLTVVYAMYGIGKALGSRQTGAVAALWGATFPMITLFAHRPLSEVLSSDFIMLGLFWIYQNLTDRKIFSAVLAGIYFGLSFILRFSSGLFFMPVLLFIWIKCDRRCFWGFAISLGSMLGAGGLLDYVTWGHFWHAPLQYFVVNFMQHKANSFGVAPWYWYIELLFFKHGVGQMAVGLILLMFFIVGAFSGGFLFSLCGLYFAVFSLIAHKEERFLLPLFPLALILISLGIDRLASWVRQGLGRRFLSLCFSIALAVLFFCATPGVMRQTIPDTLRQQGMFLGMNFVGRQADARGVIYADIGWHSGGYAYLHKNIPIFFGPAQAQRMALAFHYPDQLKAYNYAIIEDPLTGLFKSHGWFEVARFGQAGVYKKI